MVPANLILRPQITLALTVIFLLALAVPVWALDTPDTQPTLKGITAIQVAVEDLTPEAERDGLTKDQLQTDVEVRLRKAGIKVMSPAKATRPPAETEDSVLLLNVNTMKDSSGQYAFSIHLDVYQGVFLQRNRNVFVFAPTWSVGMVGIVGAQKLRDLRGTVAGIVDRFINAYLEQNPMP